MVFQSRTTVNHRQRLQTIVNGSRSPHLIFSSDDLHSRHLAFVFKLEVGGLEGFPERVVGIFAGGLHPLWAHAEGEDVGGNCGLPFTEGSLDDEVDFFNAGVGHG
jgi:hypothetical protein